MADASWLSNSILHDLIIGISGGLIVIIIERAFSLFILPIYQKKVQNLPNFDNTKWLGYSDDERFKDKSQSTLHIRQVGNRISATAVRQVKAGERTFKYKGRMYGGQIILEFFDEEGPGLIVGTMVLHVGSDLKTLRGASTYFHHDKGRVVSTFRTFKRVQTA
ncbi:MAG: hypothetical protein AAF035_00550 [Pseudomonadota bacterium]